MLMLYAALICVIIVLLLFLYSFKSFGYLERFGVHVIKKPLPFLGTRPLFWSKPFHEMDQELCNQNGRVFGLYEGGTPTLVVADPDLLKHVLVEGYLSFQEMKQPGLSSHPINDLFLSSLHGHRWRFVHTGLYGVFSPEKIRELVPALDDNADEWVRHLLVDHDHRSVHHRVAIDQWAFKFCVHVMASSIFGLDINIFSDPSHPFITWAKDLVDPPLFHRWGSYYMPKLWHWFPLNREPLNYFVKAAVTSLIERRSSGEMKNDFLELLLEAQEEERFMTGNPHEPHFKLKAVFTDEMLVAHLVAFMSSALAQVTSALTFVAFMLAQHPDKQEIVFTEVSRHVMENDGIVDGSVLFKLHYVDMLISETLRLYPPVARNMRQCVKDQYLRTCPLRKGMRILIPIYSIQRDPDFFPEPNEFRPERFDGRNKPNPMTYIPFGIGPKHCLGRELALMQVKIAVVYLVQHFALRGSSDAEAVQFQYGSVILRPSKPIWVQLIKRDALEPKPPIGLYDEFIEAKRRRRTPPSDSPPVSSSLQTAQEIRAGRSPALPLTSGVSDSDSDSNDDGELIEDEDIMSGTPAYLAQLLHNVQMSLSKKRRKSS